MAFELTDEMIDAAMRRGEEDKAKSPVPKAARYDRATGKLVVEFENGADFSVPARLLQDLEDASDDDLAAVEIERGYALRWDSLDVDFTIPGLMSGIFGTAKFMAARAGSSRSEAKAAAARENGKQGGRPRSHVSAAVGKVTTGKTVKSLAGSALSATTKKSFGGSALPATGKPLKSTRTGKDGKGSVLPLAAHRKDKPTG